MVRRISILALLLLILLPAGLQAQRGTFIVVTRTGAQIPATGPPRFEKNMAMFTSIGGTPLVMNAANLDVEMTERINGMDLPVRVRTVQEAVGESAGRTMFGTPIPTTMPASAAQTITNADLKQLRSGRGAVFAEAGTEIPEIGAEQQAVERVGGEQPLNQSEWQTKARTITNRQKELERQRRTLRSEIDRLEKGMLGVEASRTQKLGAERDRLRSRLRDVESELETVGGSWERLLQEARRAGVPESWLR